MYVYAFVKKNLKTVLNVINFEEQREKKNKPE